MDSGDDGSFLVDFGGRSLKKHSSSRPVGSEIAGPKSRKLGRRARSQPPSSKIDQHLEAEFATELFKLFGRMGETSKPSRRS